MIAVFTAWIIAAAGVADPAAATAPAAATPPAPAPVVQPAAAPKKDRGDEKVCWDETPTGTRFSKRVCATRAEIDERRRNDQDWKMAPQWGSYNPGP